MLSRESSLKVCSMSPLSARVVIIKGIDRLRLDLSCLEICCCVDAANRATLTPRQGVTPQNDWILKTYAFVKSFQI